MSFGWSAGDIIAAIKILVQVGKALRSLDGAESRYQQAALSLESLAVTLDKIRQTKPGIEIESEILAIKHPVESFCTRLEKRFSGTLGRRDPREWIKRLRKIPDKIKYELVDSVDVQDLLDRISVPLQNIQLRLGLQSLSDISSLRNDLSRLEVGLLSGVEGVIQKSLAKNVTQSEKREILEWVHPKVNRSMVDVHNEHYTNLLPGSCQWLFSNKSFLRWRDDSANGLLWITGIPGAGKTSLATNVVQESRLVSRVAYFYCDTNDEERHNFLVLLRTWVWQLLQHEGDMGSLATEKSTGASPTETAMKDFLQSRLAVNQPPIFILDGLDECPEPVQHKICACLVDFARHTKVLLFSRFSEDISTRLNAKLASLDIDQLLISSQDTYSDLTSFLEASVRDRLSLPDADLESKIIEVLRARADGMFQWAALMIDDLARPGKIFVEDYLEALEDLPTGLDGMYERILKSLSESKNFDRTKTLLQWLVCSRRPLTVLEIGEVLTLSAGSSRRPTIISTDLKRIVYQLCGPLIEIKNIEGGRSIVNLIHASVNDYLLQNTDSKPRRSILVVESAKARALIARSCVTYLCQDRIKGFERGIDLRSTLPRSDHQLFRSFPLLEYATVEWFRYIASAHINNDARKAIRRLYTSSKNTIKWLQLYLALRGELSRKTSLVGMADLVQISSVGAMLGEDQHVYDEWTNHLKGPYHEWSVRWDRFLDCGVDFDGLPTLHIAAFFDFNDYVAQSLKDGSDVNARSSTGFTALCLAARGHSVDTARILLEAGADVNMNSFHNKAKPLELCLVSHDWRATNVQQALDLACLLLNHGANVLARDNLDVSPLCQACRLPFPDEPNVLALVDLMLDRGADKNIDRRQSFEHYSPLQNTVYQDAPTLAKRLLQYGANVNIHCPLNHPSSGFLCKGHKTALLSACSRDPPNMSMVKLLLENGAAVDATCHDSRTALHFASCRPATLAELLLDYGANVNASSSDGSLPIHDAVRENNTPLIELFIKSGSKLDTVDTLDQTPLDIAICSGYETAALMLRTAGAKNNTIAPVATTTKPLRVDTLPQAESGYWPQSDRDQFNVLSALTNDLDGPRLPHRIALTILNLAEYWLKAVVSRSDPAQASTHLASPSIEYLRTAKITGTLRKVTFVIRSHDQGWTSEAHGPGIYDGSWTWFEGQVIKPTGRVVDEESQELMNNRTATWETMEHEITLSRLGSLRHHQSKWLAKVQPGDRIGLKACAAFAGWVNFVEYARIEVISSCLGT